jgi:hypothetical protein
MSGLAQWADRADFDASLSADWRADYHADTEHLWAGERVMTTYRRIPTPWNPSTAPGYPGISACPRPGTGSGTCGCRRGDCAPPSFAQRACR